MCKRIPFVARITSLLFVVATFHPSVAAAQTPLTPPDYDPPLYMEQEFVIGTYLHPNYNGLLFPYDSVEVRGYSAISSSTGWDHFGEEINWQYHVLIESLKPPMRDVRKPYRSIWAGDSNFHIAMIYQLHIPNSDKVHLVIELEDNNITQKFSTWSSFISRSSLQTVSTDIITDDIFIKTWDHIMKTGMLIIEDDSLKFKDAQYHSFSNGASITPFCDHKRIDLFSICWPNQENIWKEGDILNVSLTLERFLTPPVLVSYPRSVFGEKFAQNGILKADITQRLGEARMQWDLPGYERFTLSSLKVESQKNIHYEYKIQKNGESAGPWFFLDRTYTELTDREYLSPETIRIVKKKRRMHVLSGLDSGSEYTLCIRAVNEAGNSKEICDHVRMRGPVFSVESAEIPSVAMLMQNYPNPFNSSTYIAYKLFRSEYVRLEVFNAVGRSIGVLVEGIQPAGHHHVRFDASVLPSGLYIYRLEAGGEIWMHRMTLVR